MPIMVNCSCGNVMSVEDAFAGKTVVCNQCQRVTPVPAVGPAAQHQPNPAAGTPNPYLQQNAGYAAAAAVQGYSQAPSQYYTPQQTGAARPGRGLLITGGVLGILVFLGAAFWMFAFGLAQSEGRFADGLGVPVYYGLSIASIAGIVFASLSFASIPWAALASGLLLGVNTIVYGITATKVHGADGQGKTIVFALAGGALLAAIFTFLGVGQAKKNKAWKGG